MSVKVDLDQLGDALADFPFGYLVTVGDDYHAHTVAVEPVLTEGVLDVGAIGSRTRSNVSRHEDVTLLWPPSTADGYSLIVDGQARPTADGDGLQVVPTRAVLHRKATPGSAPAASGCLHDCVPLKEH